MGFINDKIPQKGELPPPFNVLQTLGAFTVFFIAYGLIFPLVEKYIPVSKELLGIFVFAISFLTYCLWTRKTLFPYFKNKGFKSGVFAWIVVFPLVIIWSSLVEHAIEWYTGIPRQEQLAVIAIKDAAKDTYAFWVLVLFIVLLVPIMEEVLFRGYLQNWIRRYLKAPYAIMVTSLVFAFFHYAPSQGLSNITIVSSLFLLSCALGWLMQRTGSLRAPIALHSVFNTMSVIFIFLRGDS